MTVQRFLLENEEKKVIFAKGMKKQMSEKYRESDGRYSGKEKERKKIQQFKTHFQFLERGAWVLIYTCKMGRS